MRQEYEEYATEFKIFSTNEIDITGLVACTSTTDTTKNIYCDNYFVGTLI